MTAGFLFLLAVHTAMCPVVSDTLRYSMDPVWSVNVEKSDGVVFGRIEDVVMDGNNRTFVLDSQLNNVKVFDAAGNYLRTLGREGDGPGELRASGSLVMMADGMLGVVSRQGAKITKIDPVTGDSRGTMVLEGVDSPMIQVGRVRAMVGTAGRPLIVAVVGEPQTRARGKIEYCMRIYLATFLANVDSGPLLPIRPLMEVGLMTGKDVEEEEYYHLWDPWSVSRSGLVIAAPYWSEYQIREIGENGELRYRASRQFAHRARLAYEKDRFLNDLWGGISPAEFGIEIVPSDKEAVIRAIYARADGAAWVRTNLAGSRQSDGVSAVLDAFGPEGGYQGAVELIGPRVDGLDRVYFGSDDYMVVVHGAEPDIGTARRRRQVDQSGEPRLVGYRLARILNTTREAWGAQ